MKFQTLFSGKVTKKYFKLQSAEIFTYMPSVKGTHWKKSVIFYKWDSLCDFLLDFLLTKLLLEGIYSMRAELASKRSKSKPFQKGGKTIFTKLPFLQVYPFI